MISEIMADPTPQVGLPNAEWIELRNTTPQSVNLQGFRLQKPGGNLSGAMPAFTLMPDSSVIISAASQVPALSAFGRCISITSFPSLTNEGDQLILLTPSGGVMHAVEFELSWYRNELKAAGGWSLEMTDIRQPCAGAENWQASTDPAGGTPGRRNSAERMLEKPAAPKLLDAFVEQPLLFTLWFDQTLDSLQAAQASAYRLSDGIRITKAIPKPPFFKAVQLVPDRAPDSGKIYRLQIQDISGCGGQPVEPAFSETRLCLAAAPDSNDVIVNEILFNPSPPGVDYVELYNRSNKTLNLRELLLANRGSNGLPAAFTPLSSRNKAFFPGDFIAVTTDVGMVGRQFTLRNPSAMVATGSLPSFPDDKGWVLVTDNQARILDELPYRNDWHFSLLGNTEGVALERIAYGGPTHSKDLWTSAAQTSGFGTPGWPNSQLAAPSGGDAQMSVAPKVFSPDNDGFDDVAVISYRFGRPGMVANITVMDASGAPVRVLQRNTTCAAAGIFSWDGLNDKRQRVPPGLYVVFADIFHTDGYRKSFKLTVGVARRF